MGIAAVSQLGNAGIGVGDALLTPGNTMRLVPTDTRAQKHRRVNIVLRFQLKVECLLGKIEDCGFTEINGFPTGPVNV